MDCRDIRRIIHWDLQGSKRLVAQEEMDLLHIYAVFRGVRKISPRGVRKLRNIFVTGSFVVRPKLQGSSFIISQVEEFIEVSTSIIIRCSVPDYFGSENDKRAGSAMSTQTLHFQNHDADKEAL